MLSSLSACAPSFSHRTYQVLDQVVQLHLTIHYTCEGSVVTNNIIVAHFQWQQPGDTHDNQSRGVSTALALCILPLTQAH